MSGLRDYEVMYIVKPNLEEEQYTQIIEKYKALVQANGGEIVEALSLGEKEDSPMRSKSCVKVIMS